MLRNIEGFQKTPRVDPAHAQRIEEAIERFETQRRSLSNQYVGSFSFSNNEMTILVREFDSFVRHELSEQQIVRLRQVARQMRLPFTFKTAEVVAALGLSREQREAINRIIEETRPNRGEPHEKRKLPPRRDDDNPKGAPLDNFRFGPSGPPPDGFGGRDGPPRKLNNLFRSEVTASTVDHILEILTDTQKEKWKELVGDPLKIP